MIRPSLRLRASIVLGAAAAALLAGCTGQPSSAPPTHPVTSAVSATTASKTFAPYDTSGAITAPLGSHASGNCWTSSAADPSATTYRCIAANQILDPCFAPPHVAHPKTLACFTSPWTPGVLLTLTSPLPASDPAMRAAPWALDLANGMHCTVFTGTVDQVGSIDLSYGCGGRAEAGLVGSGGVGAAMNVEFRSSDAQALHLVGVRTVWH